MNLRLRTLLLAAFSAVLLVFGPTAFAAVPASGTIGPLTTSAAWQGQHYTLAATAQEAACPPQSVDVLNIVCDHYSLTRRHGVNRRSIHGPGPR